MQNLSRVLERSVWEGARERREYIGDLAHDAILLSQEMSGEAGNKAQQFANVQMDTVFNL